MPRTAVSGPSIGALLAAALVSPLVAAEDSRSAIYELRVYTTAEGRLPALHKRFHDHTVALFKKHGMTSVVYWTPENKPNTLVYLLKHDSIAARNKSFAAFGRDPAWRKAFQASRKDGPIVTRVQSTFLKATDYSPKTFAAAKPGWVYELRTYTTRKGKLPNLNARFRDHTMTLFRKHGIHNVLYTTPLKKTGKKGAETYQPSDDTLIYVIAHRDRKTADASWKAFVSDPAWRKVARESRKDGRILVKSGVKRMYLKTTDYSPAK
ncbi:MAG: NIPSNAP family protein [Planctomycetaceae bacterium]